MLSFVENATVAQGIQTATELPPSSHEVADDILSQRGWHAEPIIASMERVELSTMA